MRIMRYSLNLSNLTCFGIITASGYELIRQAAKTTLSCELSSNSHIKAASRLASLFPLQDSCSAQIVTTGLTVCAIAAAALMLSKDKPKSPAAPKMPTLKNKPASPAIKLKTEGDSLLTHRLFKSHESAASQASVAEASAAVAAKPAASKLSARVGSISDALRNHQKFKAQASVHFEPERARDGTFKPQPPKTDIRLSVVPHPPSGVVPDDQVAQVAAMLQSTVSGEGK